MLAFAIKLQKIYGILMGFSFFFFSLGNRAVVRRNLTYPLLPLLSLSQGGERMSLSSAREVARGADFLLYCNVTLDVGHVAKISWRKNVSCKKFC